MSSPIELRLGRYQEVLADVGMVDAVITDLAAGSAAEHIVCADLLLAGHRAFLADQNCQYDVAVEHGGKLIRVQVKGTRRSKPSPSGRNHEAYFFHCRRAGKGGRRRYGPGEFDVLALVALDIRRVAYVCVTESMPQCLAVRVPGRQYVPHKSAKTFDACTFASAVEAPQARLGRAVRGDAGPDQSIVPWSKARGSTEVVTPEVAPVGVRAMD